MGSVFNLSTAWLFTMMESGLARLKRNMEFTFFSLIFTVDGSTTRTDSISL